MRCFSISIREFCSPRLRHLPNTLRSCSCWSLGFWRSKGTRTGPLRVREIGPLTEAPPRSPRKLCGPEGINGRFCWTGGGGELSVCESESVWTNKSTAIDSLGRNVSVMTEIKTQKGWIKQFFYETRCRRAELRSYNRRSKITGAAPRPAETGVPRRGCLGVDRKQWESECKVKESYVRALTKDEMNKVGWNWIRIDASCVCVLFRPNRMWLDE
uniref:Neurotrophin-4 n=1 Tax=Takifugu rubripes TaxID=31033 RepID=A0A674PPV8_TAKRU